MEVWLTASRCCRSERLQLQLRRHPFHFRLRIVLGGTTNGAEKTALNKAEISGVQLGSTWANRVAGSRATCF